MAIAKRTTLEGNTYNLGIVERTAISGVGDSTNHFTGANTFNQPPVCSFSNAIEVDAATLTIAYATHMGRPVIQTQACVFTLPAVADVQGDIWIINGLFVHLICQFRDWIFNFKMILFILFWKLFNWFCKKEIATTSSFNSFTISHF